MRDDRDDFETEIKSIDGSLMYGNTKFTPEKQGEFFKHLADTGIVTIAAKRTGIGTSTIYEERQLSEVFKKKFSEAKEIYADKVEAELHNRVFNGVKKPVFYQGSEVGEVTEFSDRLIEFHLKALKPEKYRERFEVTGQGGEPFVIQVVKFGDLKSQDEIEKPPEIETKPDET